MKNKLLIGIITAATLLVFCSCSKKEQEAPTTTETTTIMKTTKPPETTTIAETKILIPENVQKIYDEYKNIIITSFLDYTISDINSDKSTFDGYVVSYDFTLYQTHIAYAKISFYFIDGKPTDNYHITFSGLDNKSQKQIITSTILLLNPTLNSDEVEKAIKILVNSYDGVNNSDVYKTDNYAIYLEGTYGSILGSTTLNIISAEEINTPVDTNLYSDFSSQEMQAVMNQEELCHLRAVVKGNYEFQYSYILEVESGGETYIINYYYPSFPDFFEVGKEYDFYGAISGNRNGYAGTMRLDYCQEIN